jgi:pimeloyl-ACP methyl ester carboxylesterase
MRMRSESKLPRSLAWLGLSLVATMALAAPTAEGGVEMLRLDDGAEMAYVARGTGEPALVFVHCGNCRMEIWKETLDAFAGENRVVAMDLPGYGLSPAAPRKSFTIEGYGADVAALVEHLGLSRVILVGNSLGGPVAIEAARRLGKERVLGVVAVDTLQNVEAVWPEDAWRKILDGYRSDFLGTCRGMMLGLLPKDAPASDRERIERDTCGGDPGATIALFETLRDYDQRPVLRAAGVPVWAINSTVHPTSVEVNRKYAPFFDVVLMDGVGHYPQVERPAEFQRHLRDIVRDLVGRNL